ncbi:MAG: DUF4831 family protein [Bacteroidia bacterium]|nr:DUF4831 family protein [Bacteroidia bacterium]
MKNITGLLLFSLIVILSISCETIKKLSAPDTVVGYLADTTKISEGSLVYALPKTVFTVMVEMERELKIPGPYAKYADDLLGIKGVITTSGEHWTIKSAFINSHEEADPSEYYVIETTTQFRTNVLSLKKEGLILDINPVMNSQGESILPEKEINTDKFLSFDLGSDEYYISQNDTAYRRISMDSTFIRVPYIVEKKKKLTTDQLAERAARRLMDLRDGRILILTGEANVFPQDEAAINEIDRLEKAYEELFTGKILTEKRVFSYQVIPEKENSNNLIQLFTFNNNKGPINAPESSGIPVKIVIEPEQKTKDLTIISRQQPAPSEQKFDKLYYRIPDVVSVKIQMGEETIYRSRKLVYQFGEVMQLPSNYIIGK